MSSSSDGRDFKTEIIANPAQFESAMRAASRAAAGAADQIKAQFQKIHESMSGQFAQMGSSVKSQLSGMAGHFGGLVDALGASKAGIVGLVVAATGLAASKAVGATAKMTEEAMDLARVMGVSTNAAQTWKIALEDVGASQGDLEGAAKGMSKQLKENEADMNAMGLKTRDAAGNLRPMNDLLVDGIGILNQHKEGADRALAAQQLFGRGVDSSSKLLLINKETLAEAKTTVEDLGLEVGANAVAAWQEYDKATDRAGAGMKGVVATVGGILMPVLTDLVNVFNAVVPAAITVLRGALGGLTTAFHAIKNGVVMVWETINAMIVTVIEPIRALGEAVGRAMVGDFDGAAAAIKGIGTVIANGWSEAMDNMAASSQKTSDRIAAIWNKDSAPGAPEGERGDKNFTPPPDKAKKGPKTHAKPDADPSFMQYYDAALAEEKRLAAEKDALREYTKTQEAAFWRDLLQTADLSGKDRVAITKKVADLELQILRDGAKQREQLDNDARNRGEQLALAGLASEQQRAQDELALGNITQAQLLEMEQQFEQRRFEIRNTYLEAKRAQFDPERDPVQYGQISTQIELLEQEHLQRMGQMRTQAMVEASAQTQQIAGNLQNGFANVFAQIGTNIKSIGGLLKGLAQAVLQTITQMLAQMAAKYLINKLMMKALNKAMAIGEISAESAKAGAGGLASMAAAPYPINLGAPIFGATMAAAAMAYAPLASAAGGYDIPGTINPIVQAHAREMILPAKHADVIRSLADDPSRSATQGGASGQPEGQIRGMPPGEWLMVHRSDLVSALKASGRDFAFTRR